MADQVTYPKLSIIGLHQNPADIVNDILGLTENDKDIQNEILWNFSNKYYQTSIVIKTIQFEDIDQVKRELPSDTEAIIYYFDIANVDTFEAVKTINETLGLNFDVQLLTVCGIEEELHQSQVIEINKWCIANEFEMVDMKLKDDEDTSEKYGINRVIEVLQNHIWSNAVLKSNENKKAPLDVDKETVDLFNMFSQLRAYQDNIGNLTKEQRLQNAEDMLKKVWKVCVDDSDADELSDIDS